MSGLHIDRWIPLPEAARLADEPLWKFRRRMLLLNETYGGKLLRPRGQGGKRRHMMVSAEALVYCLKTDPNAADVERQTMLAKFEDLTRSVQSSRDSQNAFKKKAWDWLNRLEKDVKVLRAIATRKDV